MSRTSWRTSMRWGAVVGALVMLGGVRAASADGAAPAAAAPAADVPAAAPTVNAPPASSSSASTSTSVTATAPAATTDKDDKPVYFKGLGLDIGLGDSSGLYSGDEAYQNSWSLEFDPSWKIGKVFFKDSAALKKLSLSGRFILSGEFAGTGEQYRTGNVAPDTQFQGCFDGAPSSQGGTVDVSNMPYCQGGSDRRLDYTDITLKLSDTVYTIPVALIDVKASLTGVIPVSAESRAATLITALQPAVGLSRAFFDKKLTVALGVAFSKAFFSSNTPVFQSDYLPGVDPNNFQDGSNFSQRDLGDFATNLGGMNVSYLFASDLSVTYAPTDKWTFMARYILSDSFKHGVPEEDCNTTLANNPGLGPVSVCQNGQDVAANSGAGILGRGDLGTQQFWLTADYQLTDYIGLEAALITVATQRHPDGSWQQPFITANANNFTTFNFNVTFTTEALAEKLLHKS